MKAAIVKLKSTSPYSQSNHYSKEVVPELKGETHGAYELRTWRHRMHVDPAGHVVMPAMSFANSIKEGAKRMSIKIKGGGQKTYTKSFEAGVMVTDGIVLPTLAKDVPFDDLFVPSDGRVGGSTRVQKFFPRIDEWSGTVTYLILDDSITEPIFTQVLRFTGQLIGLGRFRPANRGFYGRFSVESLKWLEEEEAMELMG